jgi:NNP family nitrate/nitrite transporter-like MFS transporter
MFAPNVVGTANAAAAAGAMPAAARRRPDAAAGGGRAHAGRERNLGWRVAMLVPGVLMLVMAFVYCPLHPGLPAR